MFESCNICQTFIDVWPIAAGIIISVANGLSNFYKGNVKVISWLTLIIDLLSVTQKKDAVGTFKLPLKRSISVVATKKKKK